MMKREAERRAAEYMWQQEWKQDWVRRNDELMRVAAKTEAAVVLKRSKRR